MRNSICPEPAERDVSVSWYSCASWSYTQIRSGRIHLRTALTSRPSRSYLSVATRGRKVPFLFGLWNDFLSRFSSARARARAARIYYICNGLRKLRQSANISHDLHLRDSPFYTWSFNRARESWRAPAICTRVYTYVCMCVRAPLEIPTRASRDPVVVSCNFLRNIYVTYVTLHTYSEWRSLRPRDDVPWEPN